MKFIIACQELSKQLNHVSRAISAKTPLPILTGIKIAVSENGVTLTGSDSAISIESFIDINKKDNELTIEETGSIVLPARLFTEVVKRLPEKTASFTLKENNDVKIVSGQAVFEIEGIDGNEYPLLPKFDTQDAIALPTVKIKEMFDQTVFAASTQENRAILRGVNLKISKDKLIATATDSHRLSSRSLPVNLESDFEIDEEITIPTKTITELLKIVEDDDPLNMIIASEQVIFISNDITIYSRKIEGEYPPAERLIPQESVTSLVINVEKLYQAVDRASLIAQEGRVQSIQLDYTEEDYIEVSVPGAQGNHVNERIDLISNEGQEVTLSFNPIYMKEALRAFNEENINIKITSSIKPMVLSGTEEKEDKRDNFVQLITPVRTHYNM